MSIDRESIMLLGFLALAAWHLPGAIAVEPPNEGVSTTFSKDLIDKLPI